MLDEYEIEEIVMGKMNSDKILLRLAISALGKLALAIHRSEKFGAQGCLICGGQHQEHTSTCDYKKAVDLLEYFYKNKKEENGK